MATVEGLYRGFAVTMEDPGIAVVTFNQPDHLNGTTQPMKRDLTEVTTRCQMDDAVRVVVITGTGRGFCAGDDMTGRRRDWGTDQRLMPSLPPGHGDPIGTYEGLRTMSQALNLAIRNLDKLTVAAINGIAIQTGFSLALCCDFRVAARSARVGSGTLRFALQPDEGGHALVVRLIGLARAMDFFMRNRILDADEAMALGLVHEVVDDADLMTRALDLARELAEGPQVAMRLLKRALYNATEMPFVHALDDIAARTAVSDHHPDAREGVAAFREKRQPDFNRPPAAFRE
jgi:2-(1,2-epoxy-1,2-dihydrophenyl)acetyl-CoA isomerase